ncbi:hypothetical protein LTR84_007133 [Exophiala bonariae]|uniref:Cytochrome P450 n=1 Tax=Exophiala bonariae TaxID=1690606 RepID=A0AAV9MYT2_9EURO|nr:hypothetical protein LTR84_007133 [Exophiala bonariae]
MTSMTGIAEVLSVLLLLLLFKVCLFMQNWTDSRNLVRLQYIYRLWFHPLARYPGPLLARASRIWSASAARKLRKAQAVQDAHQRYGPVVRIAPDELSFADPSTLKAIYGHGSRLPKTEFYTGGKFTEVDNVFSMRDIHQHSGRRAVMAPVFSHRFVASYVPAMYEKLSQTFNMMATLSANGTKPVDVYHWVHNFALDVVFHFTLNHESGTLKTGKPHAVIRDLEDFQSVFAWTALFPPLRNLGRFVPIQAVKRPFISLHKWIHFCLDIVARERTTDMKASFVSRLLENEDAYLERKLNDLEVAEELIGIMFAGSGTAANTISFLIWAVLENPPIREKLVAELERQVPPGIIPMYEVVNKLPYLNAVIMETLRRWPTIPGLQPRRVVGKELVVGDYIIPAGTVVGCQNYTVHLDPVTFPEPEIFDPERWLQPDTSAQHAAFNGFGTGPRACIGRNLALIELQLFTAAFFLRFDARVADTLEEKDMELTDGFSGGPAGKSLPLYLVERSKT